MGGNILLTAFGAAAAAVFGLVAGAVRGLFARTLYAFDVVAFGSGLRSFCSHNVTSLLR